MVGLRHKLSSMVLVVGAGLFGTGVLNHVYHGARLGLARAAIPERVFELNEEMVDFDNDPNGDVRDYWRALGEAYDIDFEIDIVKRIDNCNLRVEGFNASRPYTGGLVAAGLGLGLTGYVARGKRKESL